MQKREFLAQFQRPGGRSNSASRVPRPRGRSKAGGCSNCASRVPLAGGRSSSASRVPKESGEEGKKKKGCHLDIPIFT